MSASVELQARADAIRSVIDEGGRRLDPKAVRWAHGVLDNASKRLDLGVDRSVVALAGATGSGKSSLFNAIANYEFAQVDVRRPTTSEPSACVWGASAERLLDWLEIDGERRLLRESELDGESQADLRGAVLLDLPDHDSRAVEHGRYVDRLVEVVDLVIWVLDPQKYADDAVHSRYLSTLGGRESHMLVVLNQTDTLQPDEVDLCREDIRRLLEQDGLGTIEVLPVSARTGAGVDVVRNRIAALADSDSAAAARVRTELSFSVERLGSAIGTGEPDEASAEASRRLRASALSIAGVGRYRSWLDSQIKSQGHQTVQWPLSPVTVSPPGPKPKPLEIGRAEITRIGQDARAVREEVTAALPPRWAPPPVAPSRLREMASSLSRLVAAEDVAFDVPGWWSKARGLQLALLTVAATALVCGIALPLLGVTGWLVGGGIVALSLASLLFGAIYGAACRRRVDRESNLIVGRVEERWHQRVDDAVAESMTDINDLLASHRKMRLQLVELGRGHSAATDEPDMPQPPKLSPAEPVATRPH